jgi:hypothetical protein
MGKRLLLLYPQLLHRARIAGCGEARRDENYIYRNNEEIKYFILSFLYN